MTSPRPYDHIVFTEFDDSEGILVDLNTKKYYQLNETAMLIWKGLEKKLGRDEIARDMAANYDISTADALAHVETIVEALAAYKLVSVS